MKSYYSTLVDNLGEAEAKAYMKSLRGRRTTPGYFASLSKEELAVISKKGGKAKKDGKNRQSRQTIQSVDTE